MAKTLDIAGLNPSSDSTLLPFPLVVVDSAFSLSGRDEKQVCTCVKYHTATEEHCCGKILKKKKVTASIPKESSKHTTGEKYFFFFFLGNRTVQNNLNLSSFVSSSSSIP